MENLKQEVGKWSDTYKYQMLSRLQMDCNYYLGNGSRNAKHLWAGTEEGQIEAMRVIYESFNDDDKPEWLTEQDINDFESKMTKESV